jgi:hypothetical protein
VPKSRAGRIDLIVLTILLIAALLVRFIYHPDDNLYDADEMGYVNSNVLLAEGLTPGYKAAPGGPQISLGWGYVMAKAGWEILRPTPEVRQAPTTLRPFVVLNNVLFDAYRDGRRGTIVYNAAGLPQVLPTPQAADRAWQQFTTSSWRGKLKWGTETVGVSLSDDPPRALSFDNQSKEMTFARGLFILGSRTSLPIPRFDVRAFGPDVNLLEDLGDLYRQTGGVLVVRSSEEPSYPGRIVASWQSAAGPTTYVIASQDVKIK